MHLNVAWRLVADVGTCDGLTPDYVSLYELDAANLGEAYTHGALRLVVLKQIFVKCEIAILCLNQYIYCAMLRQ